MNLGRIVDLENYPLGSKDFQIECRMALESRGCLALPGFLIPAALISVQSEGDAKQDLAYYCVQEHNVFLTPPDSDYVLDHPRNRVVVSSKGCITDDQVSAQSALRDLYESEVFRQFLCAVLDEVALYEYADTLSSINIHYASEGQELGWHFDNSSFAVTLLIRKPAAGGEFEYVRGVRDKIESDCDFDGVARVLDGEQSVRSLAMDAGTLVLFRGREAIHRVTPVQGDVTRMLVVLAYNSEPGISLSESARKIFYGRLQ